MATVHPGATLTPHFRDFLPAWVGRQPWYAGSDTPSLSLIGAFRLEDPDGEVGIETHVVSDRSAIYQIPMTYRGKPLPDNADALITTADHSVLGPRWIYDAVADPVWQAEILRLVQNDGAAEPSGGMATVQARGRRLASAELEPRTVAIDVRRILTADVPSEAGLAGQVIGTWQPTGADNLPVTGCLAVVRQK